MKTVTAERSLIYKKIIRGATGTLGIKVATTVLNLFIAILLARLLGVAEYGQYTLTITVISFLAIPTTLGLPNLIVRLVIADFIWVDKMGKISVLVVTEPAKQNRPCSNEYPDIVYHVT